MPERAMAKRVVRNPRPTGVIQAGVFFFSEKPPAKPADAERHRHKGCLAFDEGLGFLEQLPAFWGLHPSLQVLGSVVADEVVQNPSFSAGG